MLKALFVWAGVGMCVTVLACANQPAARECASGIVCPAPLQCAAVQPVCISNDCGNGIVDPGEVCDDGNILDGDGCSHDCLSKEACGNGVVDPGEVCDDGNTANGKCDSGAACNSDADCGGGKCKPDGCSANCKSREVCGNGITDVGEICDDGGTANGTCADGTPCNQTSDCATGACSPDGCSKDCLSNETCGNGIVDLGEKCDNGSANAIGSACEPGCQTGSGCGNGIVDPGEECDDGNTNNNDDCVDCEIARCGDGFTDTTGFNKEDCDPGSAGETSSCNANCTTPRCGDAIVNNDYKPDGVHGEQCDLGSGNNADNANCTANCQINVCGDGKQNATEDCDAGSANGSSSVAGTCDAQCHLVACGNGIVDPGEQCDPQTTFTDPANPIDTIACDSDCTAVFCGDNHQNGSAGEVCDQGSANGTPCAYAGSASNVTCVRCSLDCKTNNLAQPAPYCGDGNTDAGHEVCDQGSANGTPCPYATSCQRCNATCSAMSTVAGPDCGDGSIELADNEQCDGSDLGSASCVSLGFGSGTLACGSGCQFDLSGCVPDCGNGVVEMGEECDGSNVGSASCETLGYGSGSLACNADCTFQISGCTSKCGNGIAETGEQCDGSDTNNVTCNSLGYFAGVIGCGSDCTLDVTGCNNCGDGVVEPPETCDSSNRHLCGPTCQAPNCHDNAEDGDETGIDCGGSCPNPC